MLVQNSKSAVIPKLVFIATTVEIVIQVKA